MLDPNGAHSWWEVREQSCFLATSQESLNQLEVEKLDKHKEEMASFMDNMTGQHFGIKDHSDMLREEMVVTMAKKCRYLFVRETPNHCSRLIVMFYGSCVTMPAFSFLIFFLTTF